MTNDCGILIAAPTRWDEACFAVPAVRAMLATHGHVGVLCPTAQEEFWQTLNGLTVIPFPERAKVKSLAASISGSWDISLAWENGFAAETFHAAAIPKRLGLEEKKLSKLLTHPISFPLDMEHHRVRFYLAAVESIGVKTDRSEFFVPADLGIDPVPVAVLLCPCSDFGPSHEWPLERWLEISEKLLAAGKRLTVATVDDSRGLGKLLAKTLGDRATFFQASPLGATLPILAVHGLVIAADGSLPHLAAHAGATCVTLFGPNDPIWKRPLGRRHTMIRRHVECAPCLQPKCPFDHRCQTELDTERVWNAISAKLN